LSEAYSFDECVTVDLLALSDTRLRVRVASDGLGAAFLADLVERICRDYPEAATGAPEARETPAAAVPATPDPAAGVGEKPKGQRRRGRLPLADAEKRAVCERWLKAQVTTRQYDFCNGEGIAASTLREWLNDLGIE
jgi:hypothetical protein